MQTVPSLNPRRRNRRETSTLPPPGVTPSWPVPAVPTHLDGTAAEFWTLLWSSPPAANWLPSADGFGVARICQMQAAIAEGHPAGAKFLGELRHLSENYGLTPLARRRLGWHTPTGPDPGSTEFVSLTVLTDRPDDRDDRDDRGDHLTGTDIENTTSAQEN